MAETKTTPLFINETAAYQAVEKRAEEMVLERVLRAEAFGNRAARERQFTKAGWAANRAANALLAAAGEMRPRRRRRTR